jgi:hypothetical protein
MFSKGLKSTTSISSVCKILLSSLLLESPVKNRLFLAFGVPVQLVHFEMMLSYKKHLLLQEESSLPVYSVLVCFSH